MSAGFSGQSSDKNCKNQLVNYCLQHNQKHRHSNLKIARCKYHFRYFVKYIIILKLSETSNQFYSILIGKHQIGIFQGWSPGWGVLDISLGGEMRPGPSYRDLFTTKIADFPTLFKTEFRFLIPCLRHKTEKKICCSLVRRTYAQAVYRPRKDTLGLTQKLIKLIPCLRQNMDYIENTPDLTVLPG